MQRVQPSSFAVVERETATPSVIVQLIKLDMLSSVETATHEQDFYRLGLYLDPYLCGASVCFRNWPAHRFERLGRIFLLPPGQTVRTKSGVGRESAIICRLRAESVQGWFPHELQWTDQRLEASVGVTSPNLKNLLLRLRGEAQNPGFASAVLIEALGVQVAVELERYYRRTTSGTRAAIGGLTSWRLRLIDERLRDISEPPTLSELATTCGLSVRQLARGFRASRGITIGNYVAQIQTDHAKALLAQGKSVKSIAHTVGFASSASFCFAFRRATGITPREYQQQTCQRQ
jgi:AraC family transcriptional regulator